MDSPQSAWLISNKQFEASAEIGRYYFKGIEPDKFYGYTNGDFRVGYSLKVHSEYLEICNDALSTLPIYYYYSGDTWVCSNNIWPLIDLCPCTVNYNWFRKTCFYYNTPKQGETFINEISLLGAGVKLHGMANMLDRVVEPNGVFAKPNEKVVTDTASAIKLIHKELDAFFETWQAENNYVGNSGGFDSRLMRYYLHRHNIKHKGYTIIRSARKFISSTTESSARRTDKLFGKSNYYFIGDDHVSIDEDIKFNPLGSPEFRKVPDALFTDLKKEKNVYIFCGGNGYIIGYNNTVWKDLVNAEQAAGSFLNGFSYGNIYGDNSERVKLYGKQQYETDLAGIESMLSVNPDLKGLDRVRYLQSRLLNIYSPAGGYESILYSGRPVYMYYPAIINLVQKMEDEILLDRTILEKLLLSLNPKTNYRGQNGKKPIAAFSFKDRVWAKLKGTGITNLMESPSRFDEFFQSSSNKDFLKELSVLLPRLTTIDELDKLRKIDRILNKLYEKNCS